MDEKWSIEPLGSGYAIFDQGGRIVAESPDQGIAHLIAQVPQLKETHYEWASIINRLAIITRDNAQSLNDCDYAEDMIEMVRPFLGCAA